MPSEQQQLPFDGLQQGLPDVRGRFRRGVRMVREQPAAAARSTGEFAARWVLRMALPLIGAAAMLHLFPYHAVAGGVHFQVQATLFTRSGITADTTFGSWIFGDVSGLPIGIHIAPENVDVVRMASAATKDPTAYVAQLRADFTDQVPWILGWLVGEALIGALIGLGLAVVVNLAVRHVRELPRRTGELRRRFRQLATAVAVMAVLAAYGALSYNSDWTKQSRLTGTLGALQLFPDQLKQYYQQQATAFGVIDGIAAIQSQLQGQLDEAAAPEKAFNIMFISDVHLAGTYPLVAKYAKNFDVSLIINTGDESQFGTAAEMTPTYLKQIEAVTKVAPMIWTAGNHDSPTTVQIMRSVPGVIVVGDKTANGSGGFDVTAQQLNAYGLRIGGVADPRVYGAAGIYGSDDLAITHKLEKFAMDRALTSVPKSERFDIFATHEPVAAEQILHNLPGRVRQINSGHRHKQNPQNEIQTDDTINLVEGSTGAGGLKEAGIEVQRTPIEFSIESVASNCQFTKVIRFQLQGAAPTDASNLESDTNDVSATTVYLKPQQLDEARRCNLADGVSTVKPIS